MEISSEAASKILAGEGAPPHTPSETSAVSKILGAKSLNGALIEPQWSLNRGFIEPS